MSLASPVVNATPGVMLGIPERRHAGNIWRAPLVPVALAFTTGIMLDRLLTVSLLGSLVFSFIMLAAWLINGFGGKPGLSLIYLAIAVAASGAAYHHYRRDCHSTDDIGWRIEDTPRVIQVRGILDEEPHERWQKPDDPLRSPRQPKNARAQSITTLTVTQVHDRNGWVSASGRVQFVVNGPMTDLHAGDEIETAGRLEALHVRANPGERDEEAEMGDDGLRAILRVQYTPDAVVRLSQASFLSMTSWRASIRGWGTRTLQDAMPAPQGGLAAALLLGDGQALAPWEWEKYARTGVIHVLVVSGQHLAILAAFLWFCFRFTSLRQSRAVLIVVLFLWGYALLTGARPSVVRSAASVSVIALGLLGRRPVMPKNALAAAWLLVLMLNPADVNNLGCLLSFVCVSALYWLAERERMRQEALDPLEQLLEEARPMWLKVLRGLGKFILANYALSLLLWLVVTPLALSRLHFLPLTGLVIGPPVILVTSIALLTGFLLLLASIIMPPLAPIFATLTCWMLCACEWLVDLGVDWWQRQGYVTDLPTWWLIGFYLMLSLVFFMPALLRHRRLAALTGVTWVAIGIASVVIRFRSDEMRVTFLAVGAGGCTVFETPDGRVLLYDTGSMQGPGVGRFRIAPFLWNRGIRRIDEVLLSHGDLDHFNGLLELLDRFPIGQVTYTPSFAQKETAGVRHIVDTLEERGISVRIIKKGDRLKAGSVTFDVLHPPAVGPPGIENVRSLVLLVTHGKHRLLLTGDLQDEGLMALTEQEPQRVDVLMAPHHGSRILKPQKLLKWSRPSLIVSCQGQRPPEDEPDPYMIPGVEYLGTWPHGAITIRSHASGLIVETFVTRKRFVVRSR
jgi:competence protein ComEC